MCVCVCACEQFGSEVVVLGSQPIRVVSSIPTWALFVCEPEQFTTLSHFAPAYLAVK